MTKKDDKYIKIKIVEPQMKDVKFCKGCEEVKEINEFYKTGYKNFRQTLCKKCHNANRKNYKQSETSKKYIKKGRGASGFQLLPENMQNQIKYDIYIKKSFKSIAKEQGIVYITLLSWKRKGKIPKYKGEIII